MRNKQKIKEKSETEQTSRENFVDAADLQNNERCSARAPRFDAPDFSATHSLCDIRHDSSHARSDVIAFQVQRLRMLGHAIAKLDALRNCFGIPNASSDQLSQSRSSKNS